MLRKLTVVLLSAGALALGACSSDSTQPANLCTGVTAPCVAFPTGTAAATITSAIATAAANTTFIFGSGTFAFNNTLTLPKVSGLTINGAGIDATILDFSTQTAGAGGILGADATNNITFANFTIQNTKGDGIKIVGATGVTFNYVKVTWTSSDLTSHGAYALYPVQSSNVLVQNCQVIGSRDAGIYVGQSSKIIVRNNKVTSSVAGIEIEASSDADVYGNEASGNTGGLLVFTLPGLQVHSTSKIHVYNNNIHDNNLLNFADPSGTVYAIPAGTGIVVMASSTVEVNGNTIANNRTAAYAVITYCLVATTDPTCGTAGDPLFNPFPSNVYAHNNTFTNNGYSPATTQNDGNANQLGLLLYGLQSGGAFGTTGTAKNPVPALIWDGIAPIPPYVPPPGAAPTNPLGYWIGSNGTTAVFVNLNFPVLIPGGNPANLDPTALQFDPTVFTAATAPAGFPLPAVVIPGA
jgi:parallel beta-helix repeat protein